MRRGRWRFAGTGTGVGGGWRLRDTVTVPVTPGGGADRVTHREALTTALFDRGLAAPEARDAATMLES